MIFVDTWHLIAMAVRHDALHGAATAWSERLSGTFVTTDYVLLEFVNSLSAPMQRAKAHAYLVALRHNPHVRVVASEAELFKQGLDLHARRLDKSWSLNDWISFVVMQRTKAVEALTYDQHFEQAGFRALLRHPPPEATAERVPWTPILINVAPARNFGQDAILVPADTRRVLALALEACANIGDLPPLKTGVFQV